MKARLTGFTLLELLVVLVIVGITLSFAVLSLGLRSDKDIVLEESRRIAALMQLASDEAVVQGRELAMQFDGDSYRFLLLDNKNRWQAIEADEVLRERSLPEGMQAELVVEGVGKSSATAAGSLVYFYSSGEVSPFQLSLQDSQRQYLYYVNGDAQGLIRHAEDERHAG
jgi:general secretion pathway protein H